MIEPIKPEDVNVVIPDKIIEVVNGLIKEKFNGRTAHIKQNEILNRVCDEDGLSRREVFDKGYLNIEPLYRNAGWVVIYDKPGYNESYEAYFEFTKK